MRSGLAAALMGIGGIFVAFGTVIVVLSLFARYENVRGELTAMTTLATGSIVIGAAMFGAGYLLGRMGRRAPPSARENHSAA